MNTTTNGSNGENGPGPKVPENLLNKLFDYIVKEMSVRRRIIGQTNQICQYEGTYFYEQNPKQTRYISEGHLFPPVHILPQKGEHGGGKIGDGIWILRSEESPHKSWKELLRPIAIVSFIILAIGALTLAIFAPWILSKLVSSNLDPFLFVALSV